MKRWLILLLLCSSAWAAPAFVQKVTVSCTSCTTPDWQFTDSSSSETLTTSVTVTAGNLLVIPWHNGSDNVNFLTAPTDSGCGGTWAMTATSSTGTGYSSGFAWVICTNGLASSGTITLHWTNTSFHFKQGTVLEFSGVASASPVDATGTTIDTFTAGSVTIPITTVASGDLIVGLVAQQHTQTYTVGGSFTNQSNQSYGNPSRDDYLYRIAGAGGAYDPAGSIGAADNYRGSIVAFKAAASTVGPNVGLTGKTGILGKVGII